MEKKTFGSVGHSGLTSAEAESRLRRDGENRLAEKKKSSMVGIFAGQFKDTMVLILLVATVVSVVMGELWDALTIIIIVILNAVLGFIQEYRTEKTLEALKKIASPTAQVYRDGKLVTIPAEKLVRGDVIALEAGSKIPADCKILSQMAFECDESILTGESVPVGKVVGENRGNALNQNTVCYMGTTVTKGHAAAEIIQTGKSTQMGKVSDMLTEIKEEETPLQKKLGELGRVIGVACVAICIIVSLTGILRGHAVFDMLFTGISLAVAAIPEGLPATVTISLALAVRRIYKQKALVNKLHSVETLGCTNVICTDKTGTLTQNKMTVTELYADGQAVQPAKAQGKPMELLLLCGALCNNAIKQGSAYIGDPTETALLAAAEVGGVKPAAYIRTNEVPFDSNIRYMSVTVKEPGGGCVEYVKGALDVILDKCAMIQKKSGAVPLCAGDIRTINRQAEQMTARALRTLGFAYKKPGGGYVFLGMQGMSDPLRPEVRAAVKKCVKAGIRIVMLTGDHKNTAAEIAAQAGILQKGQQVLTGKDIAALSDTALAKAVNTTSVFARVSPADKLRVVKALKANGEIVAMTGDGVNDAPAVKEAAIGVAMGITGTDVTKEAAQIVLLDDNFATLVSAIEQGRTIYSNIRKFVRYMISCNIGEVLTMLFAMLLDMPIVLVPIQILLVNLVTDGLPAIALGMEPATADMMEQKPRRADESIFSGGLIPKILFRGLVIGVSTLGAFMVIFNTSGLQAARTAALATLAISQLIFVFECKDDRRGLFNARYQDNPKLIYAVLVSLSIILCIVFTDVLSPIMQTSALGLQNFGVVLGFSAAVPVLSGLVKLVKRTDSSV